MPKIVVNTVNVVGNVYINAINGNAIWVIESFSGTNSTMKNWRTITIRSIDKINVHKI